MNKQELEAALLAKLLSLIRERPLISVSALERECGIPQSALNKALNGNAKYLSPKHLPALKRVLKQYGLK